MTTLLTCGICLLFSAITKSFGSMVFSGIEFAGTSKKSCPLFRIKCRETTPKLS